MLLQLQWAAESNLIKCSCKSNTKRKTKNGRQRKRFEKMKALAHDILFYFIPKEAYVFPLKHFVCSGVRITLLIKIKTRGKRKWRLSLSGYDVVKCKHGEDCYVNMPESERSFIQKCLFLRKHFSNIFFFFKAVLAQISTKNTHRSINNSNVYVLVLLL